MDANVVQVYERSEAPAVKSAVRVIDLLEMLVVAPAGIGVSEMARRLGIPKSSTHMLLATLERRGYVVGDDARRFRLNPLLSRADHGWVGGARAMLLDVARPAMQRLASGTGESSFLAVHRDVRTLEYVHKVISSHEVRCDAELGQPRPLHSVSFGLVMLAFQRPELTEAFFESSSLEPVTAHTPTDPAWIRRELEAVRARGYAITRDTYAIGASGIAAPVFMVDGSVAALNVTAPSSRFDAIVHAATTATVEAAAAISAQLRDHGRPPDRAPSRAQVDTTRVNGARRLRRAAAR